MKHAIRSPLPDLFDGRAEVFGQVAIDHLDFTRLCQQSEKPRDGVEQACFDFTLLHVGIVSNQLILPGTLESEPCGQFKLTPSADGSEYSGDIVGEIAR